MKRLLLLLPLLFACGGPPRLDCYRIEVCTIGGEIHYCLRARYEDGTEVPVIYSRSLDPVVRYTKDKELKACE